MSVPSFRRLVVLVCLGLGLASRASAQAPAAPSPTPPPVAPTPNAPPAVPAQPVPYQQPPAAVPAQPVPYQRPAPPPAYPAQPVAAPPPAYPAQQVAAPAPPPSPPPAASELPPPVAAAPAAPAAAAPQDYAPEPEGKAKDKEAAGCLIGEFCIGPVLSAGGLNVFGFGAHARMDYWGVGFDYQFIDLSYSRVDGSLRLVTVEGRVYPGGGAFFLAAGMAWQTAYLDTTVTIPASKGVPETEVAAKGHVTIPMLKVGLGFMGRDHFVLGIDLGVLIRLSSVHVDLETDLPRVQQVIEAEDEFRRAAESWIEWFPFSIQFNVLRLGFLF